MYKIFIKDLEIFAILGILKEEREKPQKIIIDCKISYKNKNDLKNNFIDYDEVSKIIKNTLIKEKFYLIEEALDFLIKSLKTKYNHIKKIKITIQKPEILGDCTVGVTKLKKF